MSSPTLHECLLRVRRLVSTRAPGDGLRFYGICDVVRRDPELDESRKLRRELMGHFEHWPEFSGDPDFPVPDPDCDHPEAAEAAYMGAKDLWSGEYGAARWRLLDWLIERTAPRAKVQGLDMQDRATRITVQKHRIEWAERIAQQSERAGD